MHPMHLAVNIGGIPHLAKNERDTRISCTRYQETATCAAFIEESRMELIRATKLHRKSGGMGRPAFVREPETHPSGTEFVWGVPAQGLNAQAETAIRSWL
jgi:hypothetical protein